MKRPVAEAALDAGAGYVNDVTAFRHDPDLAGLVADRGVDCCLMHMLGEPRTMQDDPRYDDVVSDVKAFLEERLAAAVAAGIAEERIQLDPGIGFGKTLEHNLELLRRLDEIVAIGRPVVLGTSRKAFIGKLTGREPAERVPGTVATCVIGFERGARVFRVHDVAPSPMGWPWRLLRSCRMAGDDPDPYEDEDDEDLSDDEDDEEGPDVGVTVEIVGLSLYTHHGVSPAEREIGQRLVLDVRFDVGEPDALITDRVEDTVDYGEVCQVIALIAQQRSYRTLERLCAVIADRLASQFGAESVTVKASKPEPPIPLPVEEVSVEVWREERSS
jgi:dihydroneopterin aldolase